MMPPPAPIVMPRFGSIPSCGPVPLEYHLSVPPLRRMTASSSKAAGSVPRFVSLVTANVPASTMTPPVKVFVPVRRSKMPPPVLRSGEVLVGPAAPLEIKPGASA
jgi:hypothetical protein